MEFPTWSAFNEQSPSFRTVYHSAFKAVPKLVLETTPADDDEPGHLILQLMLASMPDFDDIMTLSSRDAHWGALKLLRCAFERTVTLKYIEHNPSEAQSFIDFDAIDWKAVLTSIGQKYGLQMLEQSQKNLDERAAAAKKRFRQVPCSHCGFRKQTTWTPHSAQTLAGKVKMDYMFFEAYAMPSKFNYPTFFGTRNVSNEEPPFMYNTLKSTHCLVVETVLAHQRYFRGNALASELASETIAGFFSVWKYAETDFGLSPRTPA